MPSLSPRTTFLLLVGLAVVILAGGLRLARQNEVVPLERDREVQHRFAAAAQAELHRLDELYESHLARLARTVSADAFEIRREAVRLIGIRQFSLLDRTRRPGAEDINILVAPTAGERIPIPVLQMPRVGSPQDVVLMDQDKLFGSDGVRSGWIDEPGKPLIFWLRRSVNEVAVVILNTSAIDEAISQWLEQWAVKEFEPVRVAGGPDQFRSRTGRVLASGGEPKKAHPDWILPLRSCLGTWDLASWDRHQTRISYDAATLTASATLAGLVVLLGGLVYSQQLRASALASQRVSFVNRVSHELRSPLTNILLNVDIAVEEVDEVPHDAARRLALVQEEAQRLCRLIDNVLSFSRHEQGRLRLEMRPCRPKEVVDAVVEQFLPSFSRRGLTIRQVWSAEGACLIDADALAQVIGNLLSNVEKYVPGGAVEMACRLVDGMLLIRVTDEGPGIPFEAAERIFRPFERLDSRVNEGASGTGLGLAIARDLAVGMGGSLRLLASQRGASFELCVPAPPAIAPE